MTKDPRLSWPAPPLTLSYISSMEMPCVRPWWMSLRTSLTPLAPRKTTPAPQLSATLLRMNLPLEPSWISNPGPAFLWMGKIKGLR